MKFAHSKYVFWYVLGAVAVLDQWSKHWVLFIADLPHRPSIVLNEYLSFVMVWNQGISFGMLNHGTELARWGLTAMAVIISGVLFHLARRSEKTWERVAYAMVIAGALGNALDRVRFGAVVDFIYAHVGDLGWPAFNVADSAICIGVGLLLFLQFKSSPRA
jgi:signal peptidase II